jgi:hypothetical protein
MVTDPSPAAFGAFGVGFGLVGPHPVVAGVRSALADRTALSEMAGDPHVTYEVREDGEGLAILRHDGLDVAPVGHGRTPVEAADLIGDDIHHQIAHRTPDLLLIHAGAVAWRGLAIAFPGRTHAGKTTLVAALVVAGAEYLSDEFAVLDATGRLLPYPRKLAIRDSHGRGRPIPVDDLGGFVAPGPRPLVLVVSTRFEPDAVWDPTRLGGSRSLLPLIDNSVVAQTRSAHTMATIAGLGDRVTTLVGPRGEATDIVPDILDHVDQLADGILTPETT